MGRTRRLHLHLTLLGSLAILLTVAYAASVYGVPLATSSGTGDGVYAEIEKVEADDLYLEEHLHGVDSDCGFTRLTVRDATFHGARFHRSLPNPAEDQPEDISFEFQRDPVSFDAVQMLVTDVSFNAVRWTDEGEIDDEGGALGFSGAAELHDFETVIYDFNVEDFDEPMQQIEFQPSEEDVEDVSC